MKTTAVVESIGRNAEGGSSTPGDLVVRRPDPEVPERKARRQYTGRYKLGILKEVDACSSPGQIGAVLRREGLYHSNIRTWRRQRRKGILQGLSPKKRGRKTKKPNPLATRVAELERENRRLTEKLRKAETIIEVQKKISEILGISWGDSGETN
jgi:transposase-like protein